MNVVWKQINEYMFASKDSCIPYVRNEEMWKSETFLLTHLLSLILLPVQF